MKLTGEEARQVVWEEDVNWSEVRGTVQVISNSRWSVNKKGVFKHLATEKHYEFKWSVAATEGQSEEPFKYIKEYCPQEVELKEVLVKQWVPVGGAS